MLKKIVKAVLPKIVKEKLRYFRNTYLDGYATKSYSQEGEDLILKRIFEYKKRAFMSMLVHIIPKGFPIPIIFIKKVGMG